MARRRASPRGATLMADEKLLSVRGLVAGYGETQVLRGLDLEVAAGEIVAVLGSNGVGKSTLNKTLSGIVRAGGGEVHFAGARIDRWAPPAIVAAGLIHVPEGRRIFPDMSVDENLALGSYRRGRSARAANLEKAFAAFPRLRERRRQLAGTLSGGEQQMLAIGRGLMGEPRLLILDEPSLGLSPLLVEEMFALIARLNRDGLAILLVEQNVVQSLAIAMRGYVLENGRFTLSGRGEDLAHNSELEKTYLGM
jgi:branched-chain amino acid transport system ATP-binding protein